MFKEIFTFYKDIFTNPGKFSGKLMIIILVKLFIIFFILKIFFFRDFLGSRFTTNSEKSNYVLDELTKTK